MGIRVRFLEDGYMGNPYNRRIKQGEIVVISSMKQFSKEYMKKVDDDAVSEVNEKKDSDGRIPRAPSDKKAVHEGGVQHPSKREGEIPPADGIDEDKKDQGGQGDDKGGGEGQDQGGDQSQGGEGQDQTEKKKDGQEVTGDEDAI